VPAYPDALTLREARARYFAENGLGEGGYDARWVRLMAGPIPLYFPNTAQRVRSVRLHDLHHVATEYATTWTGESEIAAWELAAGCADHVAAWVQNLAALAIGLAIAPRASFRAFVRGRRSKSLYSGEWSEAMLDRHLGALRAELRLDRPAAAARPADALAFAAFAAAGVGLLALPVLAIESLIALVAG
jgi:hypothetical protein